MKKVLIITSNLAQDHEFIYPFYRLKEENFEVITCNLQSDQTTGYFGTKIPPKNDDKIILPEDIKVDDYEMLVLPGGVKSMEILRLNTKILEIIKKFNEKNKIIAATCSACMLLISSKIVQDKKVTGYYAWKDDIINAGGKFVDEPSVVDGNLVTSPHYKFVGEWMKATLEQYNSKKFN